MGAKCPTCGGRENVIVDGTSCQVRPDRFHREAREKFDREAAATPPAPAPADDATRGCAVAFCETHRDVEIIPGPFCPVCLGSTCRVDGMRDGLTAQGADDASVREAKPLR